LGYALCCSGLIHYRRAFENGVPKARLSDDIVEAVVPEHFGIHRYLLDMAYKYVAHSCNAFEQSLATVQVAEGEDGIARFHGIGRHGSAIELLSEDQISHSILLIDCLIARYLEAEIARLEKEIAEYCSRLSSEELRMLPDGFAPMGSLNPHKTRSWPHSGKY
jgi:hypothetical protein